MTWIGDFMDAGAALVEAFDRLGGDPAKAIESAQKFSSTRTWIAWQASQGAMVGAAAVAVPGAHMVAMVADSVALLHKISYCSWGVGALRDSSVDGKDDLAVILGLWSGSIKPNALTDAVRSVAGDTTLGAAGTLVAGTGGHLAAKASLKAAALNPQLAVKGTGVFAQLVVKKAGFAVPGGSVPVGKFLIKKIAPKLAPKLAGKVGAKAAAGWIPFVGPAVGASVNAYIVLHIAEMADTYYTQKFHYESVV